MNNKELLDVLSIKTIKNTTDVYYSLINIPNTTDQLIIKLTDLFKNDGNEFNEFIDTYKTSENINELLITGTENFLPVVNYVVPQSLADNYEINSIENVDLVVPDLYDENYILNDYWSLVNNNIDYFISKNKLSDYMFTEETLTSLNSSFMKIISTWTTFTDYGYGKNAVYKAVIDFYANGGYDAATILMNSIFNTELTTTVTSKDCGCGTQNTCTNVSSNGLTSSINTGTTVVSLDNATCLDKYKAAMYQWLQQMLSDTDFYCCWMSVISEETEESIINDALVTMLINLLKEFLSLGFDLSNLNNSSTGTCGCGHKGKGNIYTGDCPDLLNNSDNQCSNYSIINNYIKVLEWVKNNEIEENKNKIYVYGKQFAQIFPLLSF